MDPRTHLAPDSGLPAWFKARSRVRRARVLFACGQAIAARGDSTGAQRSARLYQRALELLVLRPHEIGRPRARSAAASATIIDQSHLAAPVGSVGAIKSLDRISARDQLRSELQRRSVLGWLRARPRESKLVVSAGVLLLVAFAGFRWLEPDLAEGKRWEASSAWGGFPRVGVMTGDAPIDGRFHTNDEQDPWVRLDLGEARRVHAVRIENRTNCCKERAIPLAIELSVDGENWKVVGYRRVLFDTIRQQFAAQQARYVRLRVDRRSLLHLRRISVY